MNHGSLYIKPLWFIEVNTTVVHNKKMSRTYPQMKIRLSPELKASIEESSKKNNRTLNAEITNRLEASFNDSNQITLDAIRSIIKEELSKLKQS